MSKVYQLSSGATQPSYFKRSNWTDAAFIKAFIKMCNDVMDHVCKFAAGSSHFTSDDHCVAVDAMTPHCVKRHRLTILSFVTEQVIAGTM